MRSLGSRLDGWAVVLVGGTTTGVMVVLTRSWLPAAVAAGVAAAVTIVAGYGHREAQMH